VQATCQGPFPLRELKTLLFPDTYATGFLKLVSWRIVSERPFRADGKCFPNSPIASLPCFSHPTLLRSGFTRVALDQSEFVRRFRKGIGLLETAAAVESEMISGSGSGNEQNRPPYLWYFSRASAASVPGGAPASNTISCSPASSTSPSLFGSATRITVMRCGAVPTTRVAMMSPVTESS